MYDDDCQGGRSRRIRSHVPNQLLAFIANIEEHRVMSWGVSEYCANSLFSQDIILRNPTSPDQPPFCSFFVCLSVCLFIFFSWFIFSPISTERLLEAGWGGGAENSSKEDR